MLQSPRFARLRRGKPPLRKATPRQARLARDTPWQARPFNELYYGGHGGHCQFCGKDLYLCAFRVGVVGACRPQPTAPFVISPSQALRALPTSLR